MEGNKIINSEQTSVDTEVSLAGIRLKNPVMPASGVFGYGKEYSDIYDLNVLGAVVTKSVTKEPRYGNPLPRIAECTSGMLNSIGLQNPGIEHVLDFELPELRKIYSGTIVANISGFSISEYAEIAGRFAGEKQVDMLEVNISCPNVEHGGAAFGSDPEAAAEITRAVKESTDKPVFMKLTPNVGDIANIASVCEAAGADGISMINNFKAMRIDLNTRRPITAVKYAGLSGPAIRPVALRMVNEVYHAVKIPIIGIGGISTAEDTIEMIMAGAAAVEIGTANLTDPWACCRIIRDLPAVMKNYGIENLRDICGIV